MYVYKIILSTDEVSFDVPERGDEAKRKPTRVMQEDVSDARERKHGEEVHGLVISQESPRPAEAPAVQVMETEKDIMKGKKREGWARMDPRNKRRKPVFSSPNIATDYRCECVVKKFRVGTGRYFKRIEGFTTEKKTYWDQPHTCYR
jgi:hypothetical protein